MARDAPPHAARGGPVPDAAAAASRAQLDRADRADAGGGAGADAQHDHRIGQRAAGDARRAAVLLDPDGVPGLQGTGARMDETLLPPVNRRGALKALAGLATAAGMGITPITSADAE